MPEFHSEPYMYLPAVTHKSALVAWGAFYFRTTSNGKWKIIDDHDLKYIHPPRKDSIGALSAPYGPARVEVYDEAGKLCSIAKTKVANALRKAIDSDGVRMILTTGDNIYAGTRLLGIPIGGSGDEDDDWFFTYFQPYRYVINRVPVFPSIGNHDADETEERDDRAQVEDNFYLRERMASEEAAGRASFKPGLFYRFRYGSDIEFVCIDTSKEDFFKGARLFDFPKHAEWIEQSFPANDPVRWRIPFAHHPLYSAGP